jgi:hypothetical protein
VPLEFIVKELEKRGLNPVAYVVELTEDVAGAESYAVPGSFN